MLETTQQQPNFASATPAQPRTRQPGEDPRAGVPMGLVARIKRWSERAIGTQRYDKLRFLRRFWWPVYVPKYRERQRQIAAGERGQLEDLYLFLTNVCNARCKHCFYIDELGYRPDEFKLEDYQKLAPTLPKLKLLTLTGGEAMLHPDCIEISHLLAHATQCEKLTLITNGFLPEKVEAICRELLRRGIPGRLDILVSIDGMAETHNHVRGNPRAWDKANATLARLVQLAREFGPRFEFGVTTIVNGRNWQELETVNDYLFDNFEGVRHSFEMIRGSGFSVWGINKNLLTDFNPAGETLPPQENWDEIIAIIRRINRKRGRPHHAFYLTTEFAIGMLRGGPRPMPCVSAGQNVGVMYANGDLAVCEMTKPFGNVKDYAMSFEQLWDSAQADQRRKQTKACHCTHGCYLSKNIEYSRAGLIAMVKKL